MSDRDWSGPTDFVPDVPRMNAAEVDNLVVYLLAYPRVAQAAVADLDPAYFSAEPGYEVLWSVVKTLAAAYGVAGVTYDALLLAGNAAVAARNPPLPLPAWGRILATDEHVGVELVPGDPASALSRPGVVHYAYKEFDPADSSPEYGLDLLKRFIHERGVLDAVARLGARVVDKRPGDFDAALRKLVDRQDRASSLGAPLVYGFDGFPDDPEPVATFPTGIDYLDWFLDGGQAGGEVYLLFGPYGSGKSFHASQLVVSAAERFHAEAGEGKPPRHAFLATYELSFAEFRPRFLSRGADVSMTRLVKEISRSRGVDYTTAADLLPYEEALYAAKQEVRPEYKVGERERIERFLAGPGRHAHVMDMTGKDGVRGRGFGGVDELVSTVRQLDAEGRKPGLLVIDYLHKAVRRQLDAADRDAVKYLRTGLMTFVVNVIDKIAAPFDIPVWMLGQYGAAGQEASPTKHLRATDAAESKTLLENCNAGFCLGTPDPETRVLRILCEKSRRSDKAGKTRLVKLDYETARFRDVTDLYAADEQAGRFNPKAAASFAVAANQAAFVAPPKTPATKDPYKAEKGEK